MDSGVNQTFVVHFSKHWRSVYRGLQVYFDDNELNFLVSVKFLDVYVDRFFI